MEAWFQSINPLRPPQWRADRALQLVELNQRPRSWDDRSVREYCWFLYGFLAAAGDDEQRLVVEHKWPNVSHAHNLYYHPDQEWRYVLEARLLTREPVPEIAKRFQVTAGTVECYEKVFFNVFDRLNCRDW